MRNPASPNAFENVRPTMTLGNAASSGMNVTPANSAYASSTNTIASAGTRPAIVRMASSGIDTPVGLFGFVRNTTRVFGVIAASTSSSGNAKSGFGITCTSAPPATAVSNRKISNAGSGTIASSTGPPADGLRYVTASAISPSSRPLVSATHSGATPR